MLVPPIVRRGGSVAPSPLRRSTTLNTSKSTSRQSRNHNRAQSNNAWQHSDHTTVTFTDELPEIRRSISISDPIHSPVAKSSFIQLPDSIDNSRQTSDSTSSIHHQSPSFHGISCDNMYLPMRPFLLFFTDQYYEKFFRDHIKREFRRSLPASAAAAIILVLVRCVFQIHVWGDDSEESTIRGAVHIAVLIALTLACIIHRVRQHPYQISAQRFMCFWLMIISAAFSLSATQSINQPAQDPLPSYLSFVLFQGCVIVNSRALLFPYSWIVSTTMTVAFVTVSILTAEALDGASNSVIHLSFRMFLLGLVYLWCCLDSYSHTRAARLMFIKHLRNELLAEEKAGASREAKSIKGQLFAMTLERFDIAEVNPDNQPPDQTSLNQQSPLDQSMALLQAIGRNNQLPAYVLKQVMAVISLLGSSNLFRADVDHHTINQSLYPSNNQSGDNDEMTRYILETLNGNIRASPISPQNSHHIRENSNSSYNESLSNSDQLKPSNQPSSPPPSSSMSLYPVPNSREDSDLALMLENLDCWNLDMFELASMTQNRPIFFIGIALFKRYDLFNRFAINQTKLNNLLSLIEAGYFPNPYHNSMHAADVARSVHYFIQLFSNPVTNLEHDDKKTPSRYIADIDCLVLIVASLIHDYQHPGRTNAFYCNLIGEPSIELMQANQSANPFMNPALLYNDKSVLENFHLAQAFAVIFDPSNNCNIFDHFSRDKMTYVRRTTIDLVLATDLTGSSELISKFRTWMQASNTTLHGPSTPHVSPPRLGRRIGDHKPDEVLPSARFAPSPKRASSKAPLRSNAGAQCELLEPDQRLMLMKMALKCADISHAAKSVKLHEKWTFRITEEFWQQGDEERRLINQISNGANKMSISPFMDRTKSNLSTSQMGFFDFVVMPVYTLFFAFVDPDGVKQKHIAQRQHEKAQVRLIESVVNQPIPPDGVNHPGIPDQPEQEHSHDRITGDKNRLNECCVFDCTIMEQLKKNRDHWTNWQGCPETKMTEALQDYTRTSSTQTIHRGPSTNHPSSHLDTNTISSSGPHLLPVPSFSLNSPVQPTMSLSLIPADDAPVRLLINPSSTLRCGTMFDVPSPASDQASPISAVRPSPGMTHLLDRPVSTDQTIFFNLSQPDLCIPTAAAASEKATSG